MPTKLTPQEFVAKWKASTLKEKSAAQEHFIDLCRMIGHATPAEADPTGEKFTFEAGAGKQKGGQGWADVWKKGFFAWEYKGKHADLDKAYQQLLQYRETLQNPPLLVVSDLDSIVIHTNFTNTVKRVERLALDDLLTPAGMDKLRAVFHNPDFFKVAQTPAQVTQKAAQEFANLAGLLRKYGEDSHQIAHFLIRLLFCLFAEDIGLLPARVFSRLVTQTHKKTDAFTAQLNHLFGAMATGGYFGPDEIPHFDGGLFDDARALPLDSQSMDILVKVADLDWSSIEPSILGTLFERSLDPSKRAQLGAHYTSKEDILLIVEPVLMAPLRRRWAEVQAQAQALAERRDTAKGGQRTKLHNDLTGLLMGFAAEIAQVRVLDPASGSGNFLYVALKQLLDLWKEVSILAGQLGLTLFTPNIGPSPAQLYGIEVNPYAHELAQATVWIGYIQWLRDNGFGDPGEPILKPLHNIMQMDSVLAYDEQGRPIEPAWPEVDVIIGNPPFLGNKKMRSELGDAYAEDLRQLYDGRVSGGADLVTYWFERARAQIETGKAKRAGLLATQAIRAGAGRQTLERIKASGNIFYAQADRPWILEGAAVRVSMVGFDDGSETNRLLNQSKDDPPELALQNAQVVPAINADLTSQVDLTTAKPLLENAHICFQGPVKVGPFEIDSTLAHQMLVAHNPNGKPNSDVVRPWINASDITQHSRGMFIIDFGDMPLEDAAQYEKPFEYIKQHVKPLRDENRRKKRKDYWWQHGETVPGLRIALGSLQRFISTPRVAKHRLFVWTPAGTLPDSRVYAFARDDDYFFWVLHSRLHEVWSLATSSRHGDGSEGGRPTYNNTTCFETFPFPWPPGQEPKDEPRVEAIAQAARELVQKRDNVLNPPDATEEELKKRTLTNLYNQRPDWLKYAHEKLDRAVFDAYGWPYDLSNEEILARLLALNLERAGVKA
ncbi:MAG: class I SAM-dependent DNA methyltransferase [Anaerolineae bacterium]|nr:class I SAM-dependent DNA methyltransferase [Anaerolineales bacterium]MCQ3973363.1 class I SAM-dependent DNA methyltransferase [Anaerolineae bacterium]